MRIEAPIDFNMSLYLREDIKNDLEQEEFRKSKIEFDLGEFERYWDVYSTDEAKAKVLLNENIIKTMINFYNEAKILYEITIKNNYIYIKFETGKIFFDSLYNNELISREGLYKYYITLNFTLDLTNKLLDIANNTKKEIG